MTHPTEHMIRNTPEVHDCEWEPELSPWHDVKRCAAVVVPLLIALPTLFYALSELREPLGGAAKATLEILGLPTW